jgi:pyridinium-3,5-biscarboxylic acid mononucleotide synthase
MLRAFRQGKLAEDAVMETLRDLPFSDLGHSKVDHHRELRQGFPEVILGEGKTLSQVNAIAREMLRHRGNVLVTRVSPVMARGIRKRFAKARYNALARTVVIRRGPVPKSGKGKILIISAGTSDLPVAEEARETAQVLGNEVETLYDVGVAGIHRLLHHRELMAAARVVIVVAGMEGALASVVGGLLDKPIIAVPTSVGYGVGMGGFAALAGMLNSCAAGVAVVNIDNGFGAACVASLINKL